MLKQMGVLLRTLGVTSSLHRRKNDNKNGSIKIWENSIHLFLSKIYLHLKIKQKHAEYLIDGIDNNIIISTGRSKNENYPVTDIIEEYNTFSVSPDNCSPGYSEVVVSEWLCPVSAIFA